MARHRKSPRSQRNLTVIDPLTLPKAPGGGGGGGGTQKIVLVHVPFMWVTHTQNLVEFRKKKIFYPQPPTVPQVPPLGLTQAAEWKSRLICYIFHLWEDKQSLVLKPLKLTL